MSDNLAFKILQVNAAENWWLQIGRPAIAKLMVDIIRNETNKDDMFLVKGGFSAKAKKLINGVIHELEKDLPPNVNLNSLITIRSFGVGPFHCINLSATCDYLVYHELDKGAGYYRVDNWGLRHINVDEKEIENLEKLTVPAKWESITAEDVNDAENRKNEIEKMIDVLQNELHDIKFKLKPLRRD